MVQAARKARAEDGDDLHQRHQEQAVFPAPLAPTSPILSPDFTSNVTFSNTVFIPNAFDNPLIFKVAISLPLMKNQEI